MNTRELILAAIEENLPGHEAWELAAVLRYLLDGEEASQEAIQETVDQFQQVAEMMERPRRDLGAP
jgi:hypothetical protein